MRFLSVALGGLLLTAALPTRAQTNAEAPAAPRYYVGLGAYHSNYQNLGNWRQGDTGFRVPVQLTAGYQLRPRLALELGVAYSGRTATYAYDGYYSTSSGTPNYYQYSNTATRRITSVSALARYTLTRQPAHRLQVDVLGGFTLVHGSFYSHGFRSDNLAGGIQTTPFDARDSYNDLLLTVGLGLRYRLTSRFELNFDLATNRSPGNATVQPGFTGTTALGLRYRFGQ